MSFKPLGLEDLMPFGKHKGTKVRVLIMNELAYLTWLLENTSVELDNQAYARYEKALEAL